MIQSEQDLKALPRHHWALRHLPPLPAAATRILRLLNDPGAGIRDFSDIISGDASFSWEVLRVANSPLYAMPFEVDDLFQALSIVGLERVKGLVFVVALSSNFRHAMREEVLMECWKHSLATAYLSAEMAPGFDTDPGQAYTAGLLHDLGRLALMTAFPAKYSSLIAESHAEKKDVRILEQQFFEIDHCMAGAALAANWSLPVTLAETCLKHHDPLEQVQSPLLLNVIAANRMAHQLGYQPVFEDDAGASTAQLPGRVNAFLSASSDLLRSQIDEFCRSTI